MAKHSEIREMLKAKERQLNMIDVTETAKTELIVLGRVTRCKHGGAYKHKQVLRSSQSRNYAGAASLPNKLKAEAELIDKSLAQLMGQSKERVRNLNNGNGEVISRRTQNRIKELKGKSQNLKSMAKDLAEVHHEVPAVPITSKPVLIKRRPKDKGHEGAHGISAYSNNATELLQTLEE